MIRGHAWRVGALLLALAAQAAAQPAADKTKKVYCWLEQGVKICGDALPASAVDNPRTEISVASGLPTRTLERAPTDAERAAAQARAEREQVAARAAAAKARRDMAMVESYASEADLRRAFQHRMVLLDEAIETSRLGIVGLRNAVTGLLRRASEMELAGKPVAESLAANIRNQHQALVRLEQQLLEQRRERAAMDQTLLAALTRYRTLKQHD